MTVPSVRLNRALMRSREGLGFVSQAARMAGVKAKPRFAGVRLSAPDAVTAWTVAMQVATGEYRWPGFTPEPGWRVVDIGANIGVFSLWAERLGANTVAFEPEPRTFASLVANVQGRRIEPRQGALVGQAAPTAHLYLSEIASTRHTLLGKEIESGMPLLDWVDVPAVTLEDAIGHGCDLLKLDCEGAEFDALLCSRDDVLRRAQRIIIEFHRVAGRPQALVDRLENAGMQAMILRTNRAVGMIGARIAVEDPGGRFGSGRSP